MTILRRSLFAVLCVTLLLNPSPVPAQESGATFREVVDIRVTNVDVVVTDRRGKPIPGLTRDDFEIYEDGKRQDISNFYEAASASTAAATSAPAGQTATPTASPKSARMFIFYFDNGSLSVKNRNVIFPAVKAFLAKNMVSGDKAMIVSWVGSLKVRLPWTSDLAAVDSTLKAMVGENTGSSAIMSEKRRITTELKKLEAEAEDPQNLVSFQMLEGGVRSYAESVRADVTQSVSALSRLLASLSGVDGKKILVLATELLPTQAGAEVAEELERIRTQAMVSTTSTLRAGAVRGSRVTDQQRYNLTPVIELLGKSANVSGVTVYAVNPKGTGNNESGNVELQESADTSVSFSDDVQVLSGVNMLARLTGGEAMVGAPAAMAMGRVARDLDSYYSLGYKAQAGASPDRKIEVRVKRPGLNARSRKHVYYRSIETEMADRVLANHLQTSRANELGVAVVAGAAQAQGQGQGWFLPITILVPIDRLTLLPRDKENLTGGFSVFISSGNSSADASRVNIQSHKIDLPKDKVAAAKGKAIGFAVQVPIEKGRDQISVGVLDQVSQTQGFAMLKVADPS